MAGLLLLSHSNRSNVQTFEHSREPLLCEWLEKAIVCCVIASSGEQEGRHNISSCFIDRGSGLTTGGFMSGAHGLPLKLISCTSSSLSMLVDLLTGWGSQ